MNFLAKNRSGLDSKVIHKMGSRSNLLEDDGLSIQNNGWTTKRSNCVKWMLDYFSPNTSRVVSYSLYGGANPRYTDGAITNADIMSDIYPGWEMRVYHDDSVPAAVLENLRARPYAKLVDMQHSPIQNKMVWRFLVASDPTVERYVVRDIDSRLTTREKAAVDEWIDSGKKFHVMRDHPSHSNFAMSGGMWGGRREAISDMEARLKRRALNQNYLQDMNFLNNEVWPIAQKSLMQHDSLSCDKFGGGRPYPTPRVGWEHVGSVYIGGKMRQGDVDILKKAGVVAKCTRKEAKKQSRTSQPAMSPPHICFPHASGPIPQRKGQIDDGTTFAAALTALAARPDVRRIFEIGTWYGGGSTQAFVDGLKGKANCVSNGTHHCCDSFVTTFELYEPAWNHARRYHQDNPVWLVHGTTVGVKQMLRVDEIPETEKGEHYRLYYERDRKIMKSNAPQLADYCRQLGADVVLIDGNEYTGWGEFQVTMEFCRPKYLALHDTGTLKTAKVEAFIREHATTFELVEKGVDGAGWAVYRVDQRLPTVPHFSESDLQTILKRRDLTMEKMHKNDKARARAFQNVYTHKVWTHGTAVPLSGSGSTLLKTQATREALKAAIIRYNVTSVVDAPCGDLTWMRTLFPFLKEHGVEYIGVDIVASEINRLRTEFPTHRFERLDMVNTVLPQADLIFSRQALQHMNAEDNVRVINRWRESGARFLLQTTYRTTSNSNYQSVGDGTNSLINFETDPYNFPPPIETWVEQNRPEFTEVLALWAFPTTFKIIVLTQRRHASLRRLLDSIAASSYDDHAVHLEIRVDFHDSVNHQKTIEVAKAFEFAHGTKTVHVHETAQQGLQRAWFGAWTPASDTERAVILEDDMELSPLWFRWLRRAWETYGDRDDLGGISLCRQRLRASDGASITREHDAPFLYRMVGSFGFSPNARHWKPFVEWTRSISDLTIPNVDVEGTVTTQWHRRNPDSWEQLWIWWCWHERALYTLYVHSPYWALIAHWAEPGVHSNSKGTPNDHLLSETEAVLEAFPPTLVRFGWDFEVEAPPPLTASVSTRTTTNDPEYDLTSSVYSRLAAKIKTLNRDGKPLLIKINSHPCAGKTTFISKYKGTYLGCKLLDFDNYHGDNRTSSLLLPLNTTTAMFGTGDNKHMWHDSVSDDHGQFDDVVYIYVTPRLAQANARIVARQTKVKAKGGWANATKILTARANLLSHAFNDHVQVEPLFYSFRDGLDFCLGAYVSPSPTIWSNGFHIAPIANMKRLLPDARFIDKSLSGHCHLTKTCATDLKVLTRANGFSPNESTKRQFVEAYRDDPEFAAVDIVMCFHPSAMCELFMPLRKRLFVVATTRYETGRHSKAEWLAWNANLKRIAADPKNVVAANNLYDAKYIEYFTGIEPVLWPSVTTMEARYNATSTDILVPAMHSPGRKALWARLRQVSPRFVPLKTKYGHYTYEQLCENTAILHLPYQTSIMSLFEQYAMGIPILVPSPEFLWDLHDEHDLVTERTWERVRTGKRPTGSALPGVDKADVHDPNNDRNKDAFLHWIRYADFYQWPHILTFDSWDGLRTLIDATDWVTVSKRMVEEAAQQMTRMQSIVHHKLK